jgi:HSP20 family protein
MSIVKWNPYGELETMSRNMDKLFEEFFETAPRRYRPLWHRLNPEIVVPNVDMYDKKNEVVVKAELPGMTKDHIDLTINDGSLILKGEVKKEEEEVKEEDYFSRERSYGEFTRTIALPVGVDTEKAKATLKNGILEITLPKKEEAKPKEIKVEVS